MNWKKFKNLFKENKSSEASFILGLDLGNATSAIAYFDMFSNEPEIIDISGGYGKPVAPTVMQYIPATKEWVFGEYALLNRGVGNEITVTNLIQKLGQRSFIEVDGKAVSISNILAIYLKELISNCKSLNPKAEIAGIIVAVADFCTQDAIDELYLSFKIAGYEKELIDFVPERLCVFSSYISAKDEKTGRTLLLDFGARSLRGGLYDISSDKDKVTVKNLSFLDDNSISVDLVDESVEKLFTQIYTESQNIKTFGLPGQLRDQLTSFAYQHKDLLFQKNILSKPLKLYFTFSHPPFQKSITKNAVDELIKPYVDNFTAFLERLFEKNLYDLNTKLYPKDVTAVICTGGGFEMLWARNVVADFFPGANITHKNAKCVTAEGASVIAAAKLGVIDATPVIMEDRLKLKYDFGFIAVNENKEKFIPLIERNSFWWQSTFSRRFLLNKETNRRYTLEFFKRDETGEITKIRDFELIGLPDRQKGASFFSISASFESYDNIFISISDEGFGELFEKTAYRQEFSVSI